MENVGLNNGGTIRTSRNLDVIHWYVRWVLERCDTPHDELEWIIFHSSDDVYEQMQELYNDYKNEIDL